jgi:hypothetical protein
MALSFHTRQRRNTVEAKCDNMDIAYKTNKIFLGICISENIKCDESVKLLSNKLSKFSYMMQHLEDVTSSNVIKGIYFAQFHAHLRYSVIF